MPQMKACAHTKQYYKYELMQISKVLCGHGHSYDGLCLLDSAGLLFFLPTQLYTSWQFPY